MAAGPGPRLQVAQAKHILNAHTNTPQQSPSHWYARAPILVWGGGAIGGTVAAFLARGGVPVMLVDIVAEHVEASRTTGLQIEGPVAQFQQVLGAATPAELTGQFDCILLAVKAQHTAAAAEQLAPHLSANGVVVSLQNGLNERQIADRIGAQRTVGACVNFAGDYLEPGRISFGNRGAIKIGEMSLGLSPRVQSLAELLQAMQQHQAVAAPRPSGEWRQENPRIQQFRQQLGRISVQKKISQAIAQAPQNAGPINSHMLVLRSLGIMREVSPDYLNRFMAHVDTLLCLDQAGQVQAKPKAKPATGTTPSFKG